MAAKVGVHPIIKQPDPNLLEAWHFECRGSHQLIYDYYVSRGTNVNLSPYTAAAASAISSVGEVVDEFKNRQVEASIQSCLIRLGKDIGNMDGVMGVRTARAFESTGMNFDGIRKKNLLEKVEKIIGSKFPEEFAAIDDTTTKLLFGLSQCKFT